ncbi:T9SS-dependent M36 family metallopeptidase [Aquimarina sp. MMG016]|uniref:T9SS-dependent M36 family metallopeptidase n=1 Tax=Aquimarina sp. MMG016 TaxID=2822690 RepID=UPI001B3A188E|nr:T9SS-dependent M36 family metallopeptidase [Aquimarina sp. MMG016]MBQ4818828.1 T9SS-dependent M36 family metallopeptidase [Aquimarina sp. MMG016]
MRRFYTLFIVVFLGLNFVHAQSSTSLQLIKNYLQEQGMSSKDISELKIQSESFSKSLKANNVYVVQQYKGIPIKNAVGSFAIKNGKVISFAGTYINDIFSKINTITSTISPKSAVNNASLSLGLGVAKGIKTLNKKSGSNNAVLMSKGNISIDDIPVELIYELKDDKLVLCWELSIHTLDGKNWFNIRIDANNGKLHSMNDWIVECTFDSHIHNQTEIKKPSILLKSTSEASSFIMDPVYNVFQIPSIESPNHGGRQLISGQEDATASPFGWHDTNGVTGADFTTTTGNNVIVYEDFNGNNGTGRQADGGASLQFDFPYDPNGVVANHENASITNLFYVNNVVHDVWYQYGFDEASGNFQFNNYGNGGSGGDEVRADAIDGSSFNNANFGTPPDGSNPRMQMFLWNPQSDPNTQVFVVNNTAAAGSYSIVDNSFDPGHVDAPEFPAGITANLVLAIDDNATPNLSDACSSLINGAAINGNIAVVRRGECNFDDKVFRCQEAGAIAVLVVNNAATDPIAMGGDNGAITIPAVMIGMSDGEAIINQMTGNTVNVTLSDAGLNILATDGSFDNGIIIHEYGHGISNRLTGGAVNSSCLRACVDFDAEGNCLQTTEQMGEGWSDWFALMMTIEAGDTGADSRGIGTFAIGQPVTGVGIRPFPYSTNINVNPVTYDMTNDEVNFSAPHGVGSVWASMLWDLTWALIEQEGFDPDLYNGTGGNNKAMQLVIDGLKLQPCSPGFIDGRDAILAADEAANGGANACLIWGVFARRGLGWSATQGDTLLRTDQTEAFDLPPVAELDCSTLGVDDVNEGIFKIEPNPSTGSFNIRVSQSIGNSTISIFDMNGRIIFIDKAQIDNIYRVDTNVRPGIYLLRIESEDGSAISTSKMVIN